MSIRNYEAERAQTELVIRIAVDQVSEIHLHGTSSVSRALLVGGLANLYTLEGGLRLHAVAGVVWYKIHRDSRLAICSYRLSRNVE